MIQNLIIAVVTRNLRNIRVQKRYFTSRQQARLDRDIAVAKLRGATRRKVYIHNYLIYLSRMNPDIEKELGPLRRDVKEQGDLVRSLKEQKAPKVDIDAAVRILKDKKRILESKEAELLPKDIFIDRSRLEDVLIRRFFHDISFSIYGGVSGLLDYGPLAKELKENILGLWKTHFKTKERLLEIEATQLTPEPVLKASGHVDRFADLMVKDTKTGDCYRLDHLIKGHLEKLQSSKKCTAEKKQEIEKILSQLDGYTKDEFSVILKNYDMKAPATGNELGEPVEFNLMFSTSIGPTGLIKSFLRPETAQGIFVNFNRLLERNRGKLPFGVAQIGKAFRNEISPRGGLIRMREFTMAEIEYFVDPEDKRHPKYDQIKDLQLNLYSACNQMNGEPFQKVRIGDAVDKGTIANETLAYFLARINLFMNKIGIDPSKMRFRQHMANEMAHYATDCWDCECLNSTGWLECVGCADRSCYDLTQHAKATNTKLCAHRPTGPFVPSVIEPSFGIDRIIYTLLEHTFKIREDNALRSYFNFPAVVAPYKCSIMPLSKNKDFEPFVNEILTKIEDTGIIPLLDDSSVSIGRRYARADEEGTPYGITVDFDTIDSSKAEYRTVTLRFCETTEQIRVDIDAVAALVADLSNDKIQWADAKKKWPEFVGQTSTGAAEN